MAPSSEGTPDRRRLLVVALLCGLVASFLAGLLSARAGHSVMDWTRGDTGRQGEEIVWISIPAGEFLMGSDPADTGFVELEPHADEGSVHSVSTVAFEIARTETTVAQYAACVRAQACSEPAGEDHGVATWADEGTNPRVPVNKVTWHQASAFCAWVGGRLPSEAEWEYAARGAGLDRPFPWGHEEPSCELAVFNDYRHLGGQPRACGENRPLEVCSKSRGNTPQGLCDMAGNVWEWVQDLYRQDYAEPVAEGSPDARSVAGHRMQRGAGFTSYYHCLRTTNRRHRDPDRGTRNTGFRCVRDVP